jgi:hypothetical protein
VSQRTDKQNTEDLDLLREIAQDGVPFRFDIIDDSKGTDRIYLDMVDDEGDPWRLELIRPEDL